jgi:16S rRNA U516 pseudouridylate synthase RsuA-like enzyme
MRVQIGELELNGLAPGQWRELGPGERARVFAGRPRSDSARVSRA